MHEFSQARIEKFIDRKAYQYPGLDLKKEVPTRHRIHRFV